VGGPVIAVTGATGSVGRALVAELAAHGVRPRLLVRPDTPRVAEVAGYGEVVPADLRRPTTLDAALRGVERLFLLTPFQPDQGVMQLSLIEAAQRCGVRTVVKLSALGADPDAETLIHRQHGRADQALVESGLRYVLLRPNAFMQNVRQWLPTIERFDAIVLPAGDARVSMVDVRDIAAVAARILLDPRIRSGRHDLTGPAALSYAEVARELSMVAGRPIRHLDVTEAEAATMMRAADVPDWAIRARLELYATYRQGAAEVVTTTVSDVTGRPARGFAALAAELTNQLRRSVVLGGSG
jgi:uncharacterized protein YbjT (DUF2867 family)